MPIREFVLILILLLCSCADPRPPTGGSRDDVPPALLSTEPANESVGISPMELKLRFSEYVNEASFTRAFSIVPSPTGRIQYKWRGRSVTIRFSEPLRDSTTYIATLNDEFRDWHGVRLTHPIFFAFATGPVIDRGRLRGRVLDSGQGLPIAGLSILAYDTRSSINDPPSYQTQTDTEGQFQLNYIREADYFVIGLEDLNRNLKADPGERFAVPPLPAIPATPDTNQQVLDWIYTTVDTIGPSIERVRTTAKQLLDIRFSESVLIPDLLESSWIIADSVENFPVRVYSGYQLESDPRTLYLVTEPLQRQTYSLIPAFGVQDSSGNSVHLDTTYFMGSPRLTSREPKFLRFQPTEMVPPYELAPWESPEVVFDQPMRETQLDSLLNVQDSTGTPVDFGIQSSNGTTFTLTSLNDPAQIYHVTVQQPDTIHVQFYKRLGPRSLGSLSGVTAPAGDSILIELTDMDGRILAVQPPDSVGDFEFLNLPKQSYRLRAFIDRNENGVWDGGLIYPYQPAEPIIWADESVTIRPRWNTLLPSPMILRYSSTGPSSAFAE